MPVSYTHLDVYKRQVKPGPSHNEIRAAGILLFGVAENLPRTPGTVSYTHLDVYKRQAEQMVDAIGSGLGAAKVSIG